MPARETLPGCIHASCRSAAAGGFVAASEPYGFTTTAIGAAGVYTHTLATSNQIDDDQANCFAATTIIDSGCSILQASDTVIGTLGFTASVGAALSAINNVLVIRTAIGT